MKIACFKDKLKLLIKEAGYTQDSFAAELNIGSSTLRTYLSSKNNTIPDLLLLSRMCELLDCDADYLLGRINYKTHDAAVVNEITGLSSEALDKIKVWKLGLDDDDLKLSTLNEIITDEAFDRILAHVSNIRYTLSRAQIIGFNVFDCDNAQNFKRFLDMNDHIDLQEYYAVKELGVLIEHIKTLPFDDILMVYDYLDRYKEIFGTVFPSNNFSSTEELILSIRKCLINNEPYTKKEGE